MYHELTLDGERVVYWDDVYEEPLKFIAGKYATRRASLYLEKYSRALLAANDKEDFIKDFMELHEPNERFKTLDEYNNHTQTCMEKISRKWGMKYVQHPDDLYRYASN